MSLHIVHLKKKIHMVEDDRKPRRTEGRLSMSLAIHPLIYTKQQSSIIE